MGISGLLPLLKSIHKPTHLRKFAGQTLGVDAYGWLHRGTVACAIELAQGKPTDKYVEFAMHRVRMLIHFGIKPYLVFDGDYLPSKAVTEQERAARRRDARRAGLDLLRLGRTSQAHLELQKAVDVTPDMARRLIEELRRAGVQYVVAPYEADSQMAFLERQGAIDGIISEDSDLLVFGARVLLTKLDQYGACVMLRRDDLAACRDVGMAGWSDAEFRHMAILSGCDYVDSVAGMGLKTAHRLLRRHKTVDRVVKAMQFDGKFKVPAGYLDDFYRAEQTFLHQWVYCPLEKGLLNLTPIPADKGADEMPFIGKRVDDDVATGVAVGDLDPHTKQPIIVQQAPRSVAKRPLGAVRNKENSVQTPELKKSKSIESFFKPARTPLAELDPNCFTPSPSQQRLLDGQQAGASWSASPAPADQPRPYLRQSVGSTAHSTPLSRASRRTVSAPLSGHGSHSQSAKRVRLCSDAEGRADGAHPPSPGERSKFFARAGSGAESSAPPPSARKKQRKAEFSIFSDDSIEDALAELASPAGHRDQAPGPRPKRAQAAAIEVYEDGVHVSEDTGEVSIEAESQLTVATTPRAGDSQDTRHSLTQATSIEPDSQVHESQDALAPQKAARSEEQSHLPAPIPLSDALRERFAFTAGTTPAPPPDACTGTPHTSLPTKPVLPEHYSSVHFTAAAPPASTDEEAVEIGDAAWQTAESSVLVSRSPQAPATPRRPRPNTSGAERRIVGAAEAVVISTRVLLQHQHQQQHDLLQHQLQHLGSEDLLVPGSDDDEARSPSEAGCVEALDVIPLSPDAAAAHPLDLGRFAFVG